MRYHVRRHNTQDLLKCLHCTYRTAYPGNLTRHVCKKKVVPATGGGVSVVPATGGEVSVVPAAGGEVSVVPAAAGEVPAEESELPAVISVVPAVVPAKVPDGVPVMYIEVPANLD